MPKEAAKLSKELSKLSVSPGSSSDHLLPNPAAELSRLQKEEKERRELYETAFANFTNIVEEAKEENIKAYKAAKLRITQCAGDVAVAMAICREAQEKLDQARKNQATARDDLENVKRAFDLNTDVVWQAERTLVSLKKDEMAKLQMAQALLDWKDSEVALCSHDLNEKEKAKNVIEKPYEMAQADLWKTGEELKRLGVNLQEIDDENREQKLVEDKREQQEEKN